MASEVIDVPLSADREFEILTNQAVGDSSMVRFGSWEWDIPSNSVTWSDELYRIYGLQPQEFDANFEAYLALVHPDDRATVLRIIDTSLARAQPFSYEVRLIRPDGETRIIQSRGSAVLDEDGKVVKLRGLSQDVTLQKQTEQSLRESEERFFNAFEYAGIGMGLADLNGCWLKVNKSLCDLLGYSAEELTRLTFQEITHPDDLDADLENLRALQAGETHSYSMEKRYFHKSGHAIPILLTVSMVRDHDDQPLHFIGQIQDMTAQKQAREALQKAHDELELRVIERTAEITRAHEQLQQELAERKRAEETLRAAQQTLQLVLNNIPQAIFWKDRSSVFLGCNYRLAQDAGFASPEEIIGKTDYDLTKAEYAATYQANDREVMETGIPRINREELMPKADGSEIWVNTNKIPLYDEQGQVMGVLCSYEDITAQKEAAAVIRQARDEAESANAAKGEFLSRMSHELRTPLNAILGFGQILEMQKKQLTPGQSQGVHQILKAGRHLLNLVNEVLDITRLDVPESNLSLEPIDLHGVVHEAIDMMQTQADVAGISLPRQLVGISPLLVLADRQRLMQILLNLLSNAIKYNKPGGCVTISTENVSESRVQLHVSDSGYGIAQEDMPKLFTAFSRLGADKLGIEGAGLGLVLSRRLAQAMNGSLFVESREGEGSTFSLELPLAQSTPVRQSNDYILQSHGIDRPDTASAAGAPSASRAILLIEDNVSNFQLIEMILNDFNDLRLLGAMQGGMGIELAKQQRPDLILLDTDLPDMTGDEVLQRLQSIPKTRDIPVIILSVDATPKQTARLMDQGARQSLTKPLNVKQFLQAVNDTISAH